MKSFEKMFAILSLFRMDRISLSIHEVQEELGLPKSTIFRLLNTLEKGDFIKRNPDTHRYSLGFQLFRLGAIVQSQLDSRTVALPVMKKLSEDTNETVELNIMDGLNRICIEKIDSTLDVRNFVRIGERKPIYLGASGKVLLAFSSPMERDRILREIDDIKENDSSRLRSSLSTINQQGFAITRGERVPGSFAVSAPVFDHTGTLVASLTIAGPIQRLSEEKEYILIDKLRESAKQISEQLGYINKSF